MPVKLEHGKQLDRGNPEILQVWDFLDHARIGPAPLRGDPRVRMPRGAGDVYLVDLRWRRAGAAAPPHPPSRRRWGRPPHSSWRSLVPPVSARRVARTPVGHDDSPPVGIEERFGRIEAQAALGIERPVGAIPINLAGMDAGHKDVQVMVGAMCELDHTRRVRGDGCMIKGVGSEAASLWPVTSVATTYVGSTTTSHHHRGQSRPSSFWIAISATARRTSKIPPPPTVRPGCELKESSAAAEVLRTGRFQLRPSAGVRTGRNFLQSRDKYRQTTRSGSWRGDHALRVF